MVDHRLGVQLLSFREDREQGESGQPHGRDVEAFVASTEMYARVKLDVNTKKAVRQSSTFSAWGAEVDGRRGFCGPPRDKLAHLANLTANIAQAGIATGRGLEQLLGLWGFYASFRHPMFSFLSHVYGLSSATGDDLTPFKLDYKARDELLGLAILAPFCVCSLRAEPHGPHVLHRCLS